MHIYAYLMPVVTGSNWFFRSSSFNCYLCWAMMHDFNEKLILCNNNSQRFPWTMSSNWKGDEKTGCRIATTVKDCIKIYGFLVFTHFSEWISEQSFTIKLIFMVRLIESLVIFSAHGTLHWFIYEISSKLRNVVDVQWIFLFGKSSKTWS